MIRKCDQNDFSEIFTVINDAATAYKGIIPEDRWHDPYMPEEELKEQITQGVEFWCYVENTGLMGVMGIQDKGEVTLIRHAYVRTSHRHRKQTPQSFGFHDYKTRIDRHLGRCEMGNWFLYKARIPTGIL